MKTKALFFFVCLCALTLGFDAQAKVGDIVWQKPDNISWGEYDPYDGTFYEYDVDNNTIVAHRKDDFSRLWESGNLGRDIGNGGEWGSEKLDDVSGYISYYANEPHIGVSKDAIYLVNKRNTYFNSIVLQKRSKKNGALIWEKELAGRNIFNNNKDKMFLHNISATTRGLYVSYYMGEGKGFTQTERHYTVPVYGSSGIYKIDIETGDKIWENYDDIVKKSDYYKDNPYADMCVNCITPIIVAAHDGKDDDFVYIWGFNERTRYPFVRINQKTGKKIWEAPILFNKARDIYLSDSYFAIEDARDNMIEFDEEGHAYLLGASVIGGTGETIVKINAKSGAIDSWIAAGDPYYSGQFTQADLFYFKGKLYFFYGHVGFSALAVLDGNNLNSFNERFYEALTYFHPKHVSGKYLDDYYVTDYGTKWYFSRFHGGMYVDESGIYSLDPRHLKKENKSSSLLTNPRKMCIRESDCVKNAQFISRAYSLDNGANWTSGLPAILNPGQEFSVSIVMKNTGNVPWYKSIDTAGFWNNIEIEHSVEQPLVEESIMLHSSVGCLERGNYLCNSDSFENLFLSKYERLFETNNLLYRSLYSFQRHTEYFRKDTQTILQSQSKSILPVLGRFGEVIGDIPFDNPVVDPGETVTFTQKFAAPNEPGRYIFGARQMGIERFDFWRDIRNGYVELFGDKTPKGTICVGTTEPPCTPDYHCISIPTSEKCDNTNCDKTITTKRSFCYDREKCSGGDGVVSKEVCQEKNISCPNDVTEVCSCPKTSKGIFREVAP